MLWPKKFSYKEFDNEKYFPLLENSPPPAPSITFLMVRPVSYSRISHKRPPKCKGLVVAYGRSSLTRIGPQGRNFQVNLGWGGMFILKR